MRVIETIVAVLCTCFMFFQYVVGGEDYYALLDVEKSATTKEVRKAFKSMALKFHPDKNPDDPEADSKFIKIVKAYDVLKDDDLRKKYDKFGEEGLDDSKTGHGYQSWNYYNDNFGIYDDDVDVITLSKADFENSVEGQNTPWFINYYHPQCGHCHTMAPDWRWLGTHLKGVVRIGAVNCEDEWYLCRQQGVRGYPSLIAYPSGKKFQHEKTRGNLEEFIMELLPTGEGISLTVGMLHTMRKHTKAVKAAKKKSQEEHNDKKEGLQVPASFKKPWIVAVYREQYQEEEYKLFMMKMSAMFSDVTSVGRLSCYDAEVACASLALGTTGSFSLLYYPTLPTEGGAFSLGHESVQDTARQVLGHLPEVEKLSDAEFVNEWEALKAGKPGNEEEETGNRKKMSAMLVLFQENADEDDLEMRTLPGRLAGDDISVYQVFCPPHTPSSPCRALRLSSLPSSVIFKAGGGKEVSHGRHTPPDLASFARSGTSAAFFTSLTEEDFETEVVDNEEKVTAWFIDFYAPWCPPCMRLLPVFRKASMEVRERLPDVDVRFGVVDCTTQSRLCQKHGINSYPTTVLFKDANKHSYQGHHHSEDLVEFVENTLFSAVIVLDPESFKEKVLNAPSSETWVVDLFANWCGPCQAMAGQYNKFARNVAHRDHVHVASVDCAVHGGLCGAQGVRSYPTVRVYQRGAQRGAYSSPQRDAMGFRSWLYGFLRSEVTVLRSLKTVTSSSTPYLMYMFSPRCGPCIAWAPEFEDLALKWSGELQFGKLDCTANQRECGSVGVRHYPTLLLWERGRWEEVERENVGEVLERRRRRREEL